MKEKKTIASLETLKEIDDLRSVWKNEAGDFTPWLAENIQILGSELGIDILVEETESSVDEFSADIFATDADNSDRKIIIENQLEATDHDHLGKLITYASGKKASLVIWVVKKARAPHRAAIEWLNEHTDSDIEFVLCEVKLYKIGDNSPIAVKFQVVEKPNNWAKQMKNINVSPKKHLPKINSLIKWGEVKAGDIIVARGYKDEAELLENGHVLVNGEEMSMQKWLRNVTGWPAVETYKYAIHKEKGKALSEIRKEYLDAHPVEEEQE